MIVSWTRRARARSAGPGAGASASARAWGGSASQSATYGCCCWGGSSAAQRCVHRGIFSSTVAVLAAHRGHRHEGGRVDEPQHLPRRPPPRRHLGQQLVRGQRGGRPHVVVLNAHRQRVGEVLGARAARRGGVIGCAGLGRARRCMELTHGSRFLATPPAESCRSLTAPELPACRLHGCAGGQGKGERITCRGSGGRRCPAALARTCVGLGRQAEHFGVQVVGDGGETRLDGAVAVVVVAADLLRRAAQSRQRLGAAVGDGDRQLVPGGGLESDACSESIRCDGRASLPGWEGPDHAGFVGVIEPSRRRAPGRPRSAS